MPVGKQEFKQRITLTDEQVEPWTERELFISLRWHWSVGNIDNCLILIRKMISKKYSIPAAVWTKARAAHPELAELDNAVILKIQGRKPTPYSATSLERLTQILYDTVRKQGEDAITNEFLELLREKGANFKTFRILMVKRGLQLPGVNIHPSPNQVVPQNQVDHRTKTKKPGESAKNDKFESIDNNRNFVTTHGHAPKLTEKKPKILPESPNENTVMVAAFKSNVWNGARGRYVPRSTIYIGNTTILADKKMVDECWLDFRDMILVTKTDEYGFRLFYMNGDPVFVTTGYTTNFVKLDAKGEPLADQDSTKHMSMHPVGFSIQFSYLNDRKCPITSPAIPLDFEQYRGRRMQIQVIQSEQDGK